MLNICLGLMVIVFYVGGIFHGYIRDDWLFMKKRNVFRQIRINGMRGL